MQKKIYIQSIVSGIYFVTPLGKGPLKPATVEAGSAQEAAKIYKERNKKK